MKILIHIPMVLSSLLAGAHFYRSGLTIFAGISALMPFLLFIRHRFVPRLATFFLLAAGLEWLRALYVLSERYQDAGLAATRLTAILVSVSLFTFLSALVFTTGPMRRRYSPATSDARGYLPARAAAKER